MFNCCPPLSYHSLFSSHLMKCLTPYASYAIEERTGCRQLMTVFGYDRLVVNQCGHKSDYVKILLIYLYTSYCTVTPIKYFCQVYGKVMAGVCVVESMGVGEVSEVVRFNNMGGR